MFLNRDRSMLIICSGDKAPTLGCSCCSQTKRGSEVDHKNVATADEHLRHRGLQKFFSFHLMTGSIHKPPGHFLSILRNLRTSQPWKVAGRKYDHPLKPTIFPALSRLFGHAGDPGKSPSTSPGVTVTASPLSTFEAWNCGCDHRWVRRCVSSLNSQIKLWASNKTLSFFAPVVGWIVLNEYSR